MPLYEYACPTHGRIDVEQRITADALTTCPVTGCVKPVQRLIGRTGFSLKGGGWYRDGYGSASVKR